MVNLFRQSVSVQISVIMPYYRSLKLDHKGIIVANLIVYSSLSRAKDLDLHKLHLRMWPSLTSITEKKGCWGERDKVVWNEVLCEGLFLSQLLLPTTSLTVIIYIVSCNNMLIFLKRLSPTLYKEIAIYARFIATYIWS